VAPSREEWALAIARYFFTSDTVGKTSCLDVDEIILSNISDENNWSLSDPLSALALTIPSVKSGNLFFDSNSPILDIPGSPYDGLPIGVADFALGMVIANKQFASQHGWLNEFKPLVDDFSTGTIFGGEIAENLRLLLHSLTEWSVLANFGNIPPIPPHSRYGNNCPPGTCDCKWGSWQYIGKFYDHLETTQNDKDTILKWIAYTKKLDNYLDYEDLIEQKSYLNKQLYRFEKDFEDRLRKWLTGPKALQQKFWTIVDNYLTHLINLREIRKSSPRGIGQNNSRYNAEEINEVENQSKLPKIRPLISVETLFNNGQMKKRLCYDLDEIESNESIEINWESVQLPLYDIDASSVVMDSDTEIEIDGVEYLQNKAGIFPFCILLEEDMVYKSKQMFLEPEYARTSSGDNFHILCFGSGSLGSVEQLVNKYATNSNVTPEIIVQKNKQSPSPNSGDPLYLSYHSESVFLFENLIRNEKLLDFGDSPQLKLSEHSSCNLSGIRHEPRSNIFHKFAGPPTVLFTAASGYKKSGQQQQLNLGNDTFTTIQTIIDTNTNQSEDLEISYELRQIKKQEMKHQPALSRNQYGEISTSPSQNSNVVNLNSYLSEHATAKKKIQTLALEHSRRVFLNEESSLPKIVGLQDKFPTNSTNRQIWESKVEDTIPSSSIDELTAAIAAINAMDIPPNLRKMILKEIENKLSPDNLPNNGLAGLSSLKNANVPISDDLVEKHLDSIKDSEYFTQVNIELNQIGSQNRSDYIPSILKKAPPSKSSKEAEIKLKLLSQEGLSSPEAIDQTLVPLISGKPWLNSPDNRTFSLIMEEGSSELINQYKDNLAWLEFYSEVLKCIENCDPDRLSELHPSNFHQGIQIGTIWVRISKDINHQTFTRWNDFNTAKRLIAVCRQKYDNQKTHVNAIQAINSEFTEIRKSLEFIMNN